MVNQGIFNILTMADDHLDDGPADGVQDGNKGSKDSNANSDMAKKILLKFPVVACLVALVSVYLMVKSANHRGFTRDFENVASKVQDVFLYETQTKTYAIREATATAASIIGGRVRSKRTKNLIKALQGIDETSLEIFQERSAASRQSASIDRLTLYPLPSADPTTGADGETPSQTCPAGSGGIRKQAIQVIQDSGNRVISEAWARKGEDKSEIKTTVFYPISMNMFSSDEDDVVTPIGVVAADIKWADFFSPETLASNEGLIIAVENTFGQAFTFRVKDGRLTFADYGIVYEEGFDNEVISSYSDFDMLSAQTSASDNSTAPDGFCGFQYRLRIYPSNEMYQIYSSSWPLMLITGVILTIFTLFLSFLLYDLSVSMRHSTVKKEYSRFHMVVSSLFPSVVLDRVVHEAEVFNEKITKESLVFYDAQHNDRVISSKNTYLADCRVPVEDISNAITDKPIYNTFPHATVSFMDIAGFTSWCSERDPEQVFKLLETVYQAFDQIANRLDVFKIETIGDCYVAVTGVPQFQKDHCLIMVRFVYEAMASFIQLAKSLETALGPGTAKLSIRAGIHSGPVTAGVIRAEKFRFQLFGDTMNTASRMESNGAPGCMHLSEDAAACLKVAGKGKWLVKREDVLTVKGKGTMTTYWIKISPDEEKLVNACSARDVDLDQSLCVSEIESPFKNVERLIDFNTEILLDLLRKVVARRQAVERRHGKKRSQEFTRDSSMIEYKKYVAQRSLVAHVAEEIEIAPYEKDLEQECPSKIRLSREVEAQTRAYVEECASLYNNVAFHNFEHASHVVMSANSLLSQIITPEQGGFEKLEVNAKGGIQISREFHDQTYGISCDPLMHFAAVQAAMIHDVAHLGVTNQQLKKVNREMAARYDEQSIAEQHSLALSMHVFAGDKYKDLREALLDNDANETKRYYQFMTSSVLATDIADKELKAARQRRWDDAFEDEKFGNEARKRLSVDDWYLGELTRVEWHLRVSSFCCVVLWLILVAVGYWATPDEQIVVLEGWERIAEMVAFCFIACSYMYNAMPHLVRVFDNRAEPMSGAIVGVITIKTFALVTNGLMAFGFRVPVLIDPILGTRVHLLRMCEWTPMAFLIYFVSDCVDVPDKELGLKSKYFFGLAQGVSTFFGFLFPFAPNAIVWGFELFFSVILFLTIYPHLCYKRKAFSRLERGVSADDKEIYDRSAEALKFLETLWVTWAELVLVFLVEGLGPLAFPQLSQIVRVEGFGIGWMAFIDCYPKMKYVNHITKLHEIVFDTRARAERQKAESIRLKHLSNKKATILFEYIIQASDVAHCMQDWGIYQKYNRRLFEEQFNAFLKGYTKDDPRPGWYKGEIWFFENYIIPLAQKLCDSGCFGVSGHQYLRNANANLREWREKGEEVTASMIARCETKLTSLGDASATESESSFDSDDNISDDEGPETYTGGIHCPPRFGVHGRMFGGKKRTTTKKLKGGE